MRGSVLGLVALILIPVGAVWMDKITGKSNFPFVLGSAESGLSRVGPVEKADAEGKNTSVLSVSEDVKEGKKNLQNLSLERPAKIEEEPNGSSEDNPEEDGIDKFVHAVVNVFVGDYPFQYWILMLLGVGSFIFGVLFHLCLSRCCYDKHSSVNYSEAYF
ncbi:hypothetical protein AAMO2058_000648600 [Amorphochlora amoebiformis]